MKDNPTTPSVVSTLSTPAAVVASGYTLGLDLGDRRHHVCVLDAAGQSNGSGEFQRDGCSRRAFPATVAGR